MPIVFDLDGTLIDSAPSIEAALQKAFVSCNVLPEHPINRSIVGPSLSELIHILAPRATLNEKEALALAFKAHYDEQELLNFKLFPGIADLLQSLNKANKDLFLLTNKRRLPTEKILNYLDWQDLFKGVNTPDDLDDSSPKTKTRLIAHFLKFTSLQAKHCIYIGDREEDGLAAHANNMPFIQVGWGYANNSATVRVQTVRGLVSELGWK